MNLNPALTGVFKGDNRAVANYRNQWSSVPVPYMTFSGAYDQKIYAKSFGRGFLGGGLVFNYDKAGDGDLSWSQLGVNISYTQPMSTQFFITGGFQYLIAGRSFKPDQLSFGEQWNGDIYDPDSYAGESFKTSSGALHSMSGGLNLHFQLAKTRTRFDAGFGMFHINYPTANFMQNSKVELPRKGNGYLNGTVQFHPKMDFRVFALYSFQGEFKETVTGTALRYHLSTVQSREVNFQIGSGFRLGDAIIPHVEVQMGAIRIGLSYDSNISRFNLATRKRGGPEVSVEYILTKVKEVRTFKACPIF